MNDTTYSTLAEGQLIKLYADKTVSDESINAEWFKRFGLSFPYKLNPYGEIVNCLWGATVSDDEMDKMVLRQAIERRKLKGVEK